MYRLLVTLRQLEQKQVSEKAMLPMKDTRELLYRMLKAGTISLQVCAAPEHALSTCPVLCGLCSYSACFETMCLSGVYLTRSSQLRAGHSKGSGPCAIAYDVHIACRLHSSRERSSTRSVQSCTQREAAAGPRAHSTSGGATRPMLLMPDA